MSRVGKLLRLAETRRRDHELVELRLRVSAPLRESLRRRCGEDGITVPALLEALIRGFVDKHPSALAMVDQWVRDEGHETKHPEGPVLSGRDLSDVYAAIARGGAGKED